MPKVTLRHKDEHFESLLRRFKKTVEKSGVLDDYMKHRFYEKPSEQRRKRLNFAKRQQQRIAEANKSPAIWVDPETQNNK